jgi:hypothetical protein
LPTRTACRSLDPGSRPPHTPRSTKQVEPPCRLHDRLKFRVFENPDRDSPKIIAPKIEDHPRTVYHRSDTNSMMPQARNILAEPYRWPHDGNLSSTTALVIIDMQNDCEFSGRFTYFWLMRVGRDSLQPRRVPRAPRLPFGAHAGANTAYIPATHGISPPRMACVSYPRRPPR